MRKFIIAAALAFAPLAAQASSYDAVADFSLTNPNGVWSYGTGVNGVSFAPFTQTYNPCFGAGNFECYSDDATSSSTVPGLGKTTDGGTATFATVSVPSDVLWLHPGAAATGADAILRFTAPSAGSYTLSGLFERLDTTASGNGVIATIDLNGAPIYTSSTLGSFSSALTLAQGDVISFGVNNAGEYTFDSTGLAAKLATVSAAPEPGTWALLFGGLAVVGGVLRLRRAYRDEKAASDLASA